MKVGLGFHGCHRRGGVERVMVECANFLQGRGHEVGVYAVEYDAGVLNAGVEMRPVSAKHSNNLVYLSRFDRMLKQAVRDSKPALDVVGTYGVLSPPGSVVWVQAVHRAWMEISAQQRNALGRVKQKLNPYHPLILHFERQVYGERRYGKLLALSEQVKADLMRLYHVPDDDIVIVPNGYSPNEFNVQRCQQMRTARRAELGYGEEDRVVIFVANELERKGFAPLLRSIVALSDSRIQLLAVGRLNPQTYAPEIERLGMTERVRFTGPSADVATFYAAADVFALPTQYEAWGLVITEAMACGLPVLTSRVAGAAIAIHEGETGQLLDDPKSVSEIADKLALLLEAKHRSRHEIAASVAPYAWSQVLMKYEETLLQNPWRKAFVLMKELMNPKVCLLTDADVFAGTERHMLTLACGLRTAGVEVHLTAPSPSELETRAQAVGIAFLAIAKRGLVDREAIGVLRAKLQDGTFDIIHAHNGRTALQAAIAVRLAGRGRCITTQHFLEPHHATQHGVKGTVSHLAHRWVSRHTHHVIAISEAVRQAMLARGEVPDTKITVVWNGIDAPEPTALMSKAQVREAIGIQGNAPLVVCAARLEKEKDIGTLIAAMAQVAVRLPGAQCVIAGTGTLEAELREQVRTLGLETSVTLLGFRSDVLTLIHAGDLFVLPSLAEPFGLAVIEAMALGRPVIATRVGGPREIVLEGETGLLIPPSQPTALAQALLALLLDTGRRERMGESGRQRFCTHFRSEQMTQATLSVYRRTLV